jgi:hypothetical protein
MNFLLLIPMSFIIVSLKFVCGNEHFLANINHVSLKRNVIFIVYLAFATMFRFESDYTDPTACTGTASAFHPSTARSLLLYWRTACKSSGKSLPWNQIVTSAVMLMFFLHMQ